MIPLVLLVVAGGFGVSAAADGRWDGRTVIAIILMIVAVLVWWIRVERDVTAAEQADLDAYLDRAEAARAAAEKGLDR